MAAARLLRLSETQFQDAFGLSGTLSTVPAARKWNWVERPLWTPKDVVAAPAETGVKAALLAAAGWHGSRDIPRWRDRLLDHGRIRSLRLLPAD